MSPYYVKSMTLSSFEAVLRQKEGELASYMSRLASLESIRNCLADELVKMTLQCEKLLGETVVLPGLQSELEALRRRQGRIPNSNGLLFTSVSLLCKIYYYLCCKCIILFVCTKY